MQMYIYTCIFVYDPGHVCALQYLSFHAVTYATRVGRGAGDFGNAKEPKIIYCQCACVVKS
jgi:hypothetical protein